MPWVHCEIRMMRYLERGLSMLVYAVRGVVLVGVYVPLVLVVSLL